MGPSSPRLRLNEEINPGRRRGAAEVQGGAHTAFGARALGRGGLEVTLAVQCRGEGHVVQSPGHAVGAGVGRHSRDAVLSLVGRQLAAQLVHGDIVLVPGQDLEGSHDLVCCICVSRLPGHEVDEGLECHYPQAVGVHNAHDTGKLCLSHVVTHGDKAGAEIIRVHHACLLL